MVEQLDISERRACRYAGLSRTSYRAPPASDVASGELGARIVELAHVRRRFGYRRIHDLLTREGCKVNHKRVWRLYKLNELSVRKRRKAKRVSLERTPVLGTTLYARGEMRFEERDAPTSLKLIEALFGARLLGSQTR